MLGSEDLEECLSKGPLGRVALAWNRQGFTGAGRGLVLDQVFEVVIVDVNCAE